MTEAPVVFLHGIGQDASSWDGVIAALPGVQCTALELAPVWGRDDFTLEQAVDQVLELIEHRGPVHLVGLSLGAVLATKLAADHPDRVASLVLSGGQVAPPRQLMRLQNAVIGVLPARLAAPPGMTKAQMLAVLRSIAEMDLSTDLVRITARTLVLAGEKDRPNLPAARQLADGIGGAMLQIVPGARHEWNVAMPAEFARRLRAFLPAS